MKREEKVQQTRRKIIDFALEELNVNILEGLLSRMPLRISIDYKKAARLFIQVFNFAELQYAADNGKEAEDVLDLEHLNQQILDILFYGILDRKCE